MKVNKVLEKHRKDGKIRSALDAEIVLYADEDAFKALDALGDELRFLLITSDARVVPQASLSSGSQVPSSSGLTRGSTPETTGMEGLLVDVIVSGSEKCERCWQHRPEVGKSSEHPTLCQRCEDNILDLEKERQYA